MIGDGGDVGSMEASDQDLWSAMERDNGQLRVDERCDGRLMVMMKEGWR